MSKETTVGKQNASTSTVPTAIPRGPYRTSLPGEPPRTTTDIGAGNPHMQVTGKDRHKYMQTMGAGDTAVAMMAADSLPALRPATVGGSVPQTTVTLGPAETNGGVSAEPPPVTAEDDSREKDAGVQTEYRETETQTAPFTPDFVVDGDTEPEALRLARGGLGWGRGLPAGKEDVEAIAWERRRRALESTLPPPGTDAVRRKEIENELRAMDSQRHEEEIDRANADKVRALRDAVSGLDEQTRARADARVAHIVERSEAGREKAIEASRRRRLRALRKLEEERKEVLGPTSSTPLSSMAPPSTSTTRKPDVISELSDYGSRTLAPLDRDGAKPIGPGVRAEPDIMIGRLSHLAVAAVPSEEVGVPSRRSAKKIASSSDTREERRRKQTAEKQAAMAESVRRTAAAEIATASSALGEDGTDEYSGSLSATATSEIAGQRQSLSQLGLACAQKVTRQAPRPPTPSVQPMNSSEEERAAAVLLLQRLLRGRAIQNEMYEGLRRRRELIDELTTDIGGKAPPASAQQRGDGAEKAATETETEAEERRNAEGRAAVEMKVGEVVGRALDFMAKELIRQRDHARLIAIAEAAARQRENREAAERQRRDVEVERQKMADRSYREIMESGSAVADFVLASVFKDATEKTATKQALEIAKNFKPPNVDVEPEDIVQEVHNLMETFLWPTVEKKMRSKNDSQDEQKYSVASYRVLMR